MGFHAEKGIGFCGLACVLCREEDCPGCRDGTKRGCTIYQCCKGKDLNGCWECLTFPCDEQLPQSVRNRAFGRCVKEDGIEQLVKYLKANYDKGIIYHDRGTKGDYDDLITEEGIIDLVRSGKYSPFQNCPVYETIRFTFRKANEKDADDLLECYSDPVSALHFNSDNCTSDFVYQNVDEMKRCIRFWDLGYNEHWYVRWSVIDKCSNRAIGTIELFPKKGCGLGILRIDLASSFETVETYNEILQVAVGRFFKIFTLESIITKAVPGDVQRLSSLRQNGFARQEDNSITPYPDYYIRNKLD